MSNKKIAAPTKPRKGFVDDPDIGPRFDPVSSLASLREQVVDARAALVELLTLSHEVTMGESVPKVEHFARPLMQIGASLRGVEMVADDLDPSGGRTAKVAS